MIKCLFLLIGVDLEALVGTHNMKKEDDDDEDEIIEDENPKISQKAAIKTQDTKKEMNKSLQSLAKQQSIVKEETRKSGVVSTDVCNSTHTDKTAIFLNNPGLLL